MNCHCGLPLHYVSKTSQTVVEEIVARLGPEIRVQVGKKTWLVPRHYIALHGLNALELPFLGFREAK